MKKILKSILKTFKIHHMIRFINKNQIKLTVKMFTILLNCKKMYDVLFMSKNILRFPVIKIQ